MKTLVLPLKKKWFDMIKSGEKLEEYREINEYWKKRLTLWLFMGESFRDNDVIVPKEYDTITFTLGYPRKDDTERRITFKNPSIWIGEGLEKWGAEKGKQYFIITWKGGEE